MLKDTLKSLNVAGLRPVHSFVVPRGRTSPTKTVAGDSRLMRRLIRLNSSSGVFVEEKLFPPTMEKDLRRFPGCNSPPLDMTLNFLKGQPSLPEVPDGRAGQEQVSIVAVSQSSHVRVTENRDIVHLEVFLQEMA